VKENGSEEKKEADKSENVKDETEVDTLNNNKVLEPDVKSNDVKLNLTMNSI